MCIRDRVGIAIMPQAYVIYTSFKNTQGKIFVDGYSLQSYQTAIGKLGRSIQNPIRWVARWRGRCWTKRFIPS